MTAFPSPKRPSLSFGMNSVLESLLLEGEGEAGFQEKGSRRAKNDVQDALCLSLFCPVKSPYEAYIQSHAHATLLLHQRWASELRDSVTLGMD